MGQITAEIAPAMAQDPYPLAAPLRLQRHIVVKPLSAEVRDQSGRGQQMAQADAVVAVAGKGQSGPIAQSWMEDPLPGSRSRYANHLSHHSRKKGR
jgi:hypothetical protein